MFCCTNCFNNKYIIEYIESQGEHDDCNYCMSSNVPVIDIAIMGEFIRESLAKAYVNVTTDDIPYHLYEDSAETINEVLRYSECIFSTKIDDNDKCEELMKDLFESSGPSYRDIAQGDIDVWESGEAQIILKDSFYGLYNSDFALNWERFKEVVKHGNRFFDMNGNNSRESMLSIYDCFFALMEVDLEAGSLIWRARSNSNGPFNDIKDRSLECGPPPVNFAKSFRMNPDGISYFYGAEDKETCIKEIRAAERDNVVFGQFQTKRSLKLINLSTVPDITPPSIFSDDYDHNMVWAKDFLSLFCAEISSPVDEKDAPIEYIPTQILSEYVRSRGYDGVCYHSSFTQKNNYTLFCGGEKPDSLYSDWYNDDDPLFPNFMKWLDLVQYEYVKAPCANQS
ncbi:RES domain-containing protein (plasmid) [Bacillus sp. HNR-4]|uniref:RES domain-containing protein n=1 Tax=Bacillus sp. HNR-4 TaxID=2796141 RepID=UPI0023788CC7|nr:RES domain-containing protein [Bacillus sp. HNR-4]WDL94878.1 RES domain-containing protein [Bacillus sp. HNR-4]